MGLARNAWLAILLIFMLCIGVSAQSQLKISGPDTAQVAQTVQLDIQIPAAGYSRVQLDLCLDSSQVEVASPLKVQGWDLHIQGPTVTLSRVEGSPPDIHLILKLRIRTLPVQTKIRLAVQNVTGFGTGEPVILGEASHEITVAAPLSSDNFLTELAIVDGTLTPEFHPDITKYSATVAAHCQQPKLHTVGAEKSGVEVTQTAFDQEGACVVTITVTAENGSQRVYTVTVTRQKPTETEPASSAATEQTVDPTAQTADQSLPQPQKPAQEGVPGWLLAAAVLAGAALGGAGTILLEQRKKKDR